MYQAFGVACVAFFLFVCGCSDPPATTVSVDCARAQADGVSVDCGDGDTNSNVGGDSAAPIAVDAGSGPVLQAGCFQDLDKCPQKFAQSWLIEHCTIPYACPAANTPNPDELICLRFIMVDCWDDNSN